MGRDSMFVKHILCARLTLNFIYVCVSSCVLMLTLSLLKKKKKKKKKGAPKQFNPLLKVLPSK